MQEKKILVRAIEIQKEHCTYFSERIKLQFGKKKKKPYIVMHLKLQVKNYWGLIISEKCLVTPNFLSRFQQPLLRSSFPA